MVLVDTSIWISHLREGDEALDSLLMDGEVVCHPFIIGELACGKLANRHEILQLLRELPHAIVSEKDEVLDFIDHHELMGRGVGLVDVHLLASALLTGVPIWTSDRKLRDVARNIGISYQ